MEAITQAKILKYALKLKDLNDRLEKANPFKKKQSPLNEHKEKLVETPTHPDVFQDAYIDSDADDQC